MAEDVDPLPAAERALELDPNIAEAHCVKARYLRRRGGTRRPANWWRRRCVLDPESFEANKEAGRLKFRQGHIAEALAHFAKAAALMDGDYHDTGC